MTEDTAGRMVSGPSNDHGPSPTSALGIARGVTWRVIIVAFVVAPINAYFMAYLNGPRGVEDPTVVALFWNVVFLLFLFRLINAALLKWAPRLAFSPAEMIAFFILMSVATTAGGLDTMKTTFATMQGPAYFANEVNHWEQLFFRELPHAMTVNDMPALNRLWDGGHSVLDRQNWQPWLGPVFRWWLLYTCMWAAPAGLAVILRKRWVEQERMSFPIVQLPLEMSQPTFSGFNHPAFWIAAIAVLGVNLLNGMHEFYPALPVAAIKINQSQTFNLSKFFINRPWNAVGWWWMCFYPWVIGLGLLLPSELSLSLWVFYLFWKVEAIAVTAMGFTNIREFPYMKEQSFGGYLAILGFSLWAGRRTWAGVWQRILAGASKSAGAHETHDAAMQNDHGEALSYRASALLFLAGMVGAIIIGVSIKLSWAVSIAFFLQYYIMTAIIGRIRAEMGLPTHELERLGPTVMQGNILGPRILGVQNLTSLSVFFGFTRGMRNIPFPLQFEALYLAKNTGSSQRRLLLATLVMIPVAVALSFFMTLWLGYRHGLGMDWAKWMPWSCQESWNQLVGWLNRNEPFQWGRIWASVVGFGVYFGLMLLRTRWIGWPLHPAGFALSTTWYMAHMWCPMMIAWIAKTVTLRYAGGKAMRGLRAAAFGLILADIVAGTIWTLYGLFTNTTTYSFWP